MLRGGAVHVLCDHKPFPDLSACLMRGEAWAVDSRGLVSSFCRQRTPPQALLGATWLLPTPRMPLSQGSGWGAQRTQFSASRNPESGPLACEPPHLLAEPMLRRPHHFLRLSFSPFDTQASPSPGSWHCSGPCPLAGTHGCTDPTHTPGSSGAPDVQAAKSLRAGQAHQLPGHREGCASSRGETTGGGGPCRQASHSRWEAGPERHVLAMWCPSRPAGRAAHGPVPPAWRGMGEPLSVQTPSSRPCSLHPGDLAPVQPSTA